VTARGWRTAFATLGLITLVGCSASAGANSPGAGDGATSGVSTNGVTTAGVTTSTTIPLIAALPTTPTTSSTTTSTSTSTTTTTTGPPVALDVNLASDVGLIASNATEQQILMVDQFIQRCRSLWPGSNRSIAMSISHHGQFVASWTVGKTNNGNPIDLTARFRIASMSKLLTSLTAMRLVEQGLIQLDVPFVQQYATDDAAADSRFARITPRHLLTHSSGLPGLRGSFFRSTVNDWHEAVEVAFERDMLHEPGTAFFYSNANFVMLGALIEQKSGLPYEQAVHQLVLGPLGIVTAEMVETEEQPEGDPGYVVTPGRLYMQALGPAGAWVMTATDAARLMAAFDPTLGPLVLTADSLATMRTWNGIQSDGPTHYQYGVGVMLVAPGTYLGHTGTIESVRSFALLLPNGYAVTVLSTSEKTVANGSALIDFFRAEVDALAALP
jgi:D-alanyl-D-alanine carboxypeptidase